MHLHSPFSTATSSIVAFVNTRHIKSITCITNNETFSHDFLKTECKSTGYAECYNVMRKSIGNVTCVPLMIRDPRANGKNYVVVTFGYIYKRLNTNRLGSALEFPSS